MSDGLTNDQIALLCEIGEHELWKIDGDTRRERDLQRLLSAGYVEYQESDSGRVPRLSAKAVTFLGERGVGLNEA
jgi:hypothetical protein